MGSSDEFIRRVLLCLENFFQKASEFDVFEDLVFSYKIKSTPEDKCCSQFLASFVELAEELQLVIKECMVLSDNEWKLYEDQNAQDHLPSGNDQDDVVTIPKSPLAKENIDKSLDTVFIEVERRPHYNIKLDDSINKLLLPNQQPHLPVKLHFDNITNIIERYKTNTDLSVNILPVQNNVRNISTANGDTTTRNNVFQCEYCLKKFQTLLKLTNHLCKKRTDLVTSQEVRIKLESSAGANVNISIDDSTTISVDNDEVQNVTQEERTGLTTQQSAAISLEQPFTVLQQTIDKTITDSQKSGGVPNQLRKEESDLPVYSCALCCISFLEKSRWDEHVCKDKEGNAFQSNCKRGLVATRTLLKDRHRFVCGICSETYRSLSRIMYHLVRCVTGPYNCEICANSFPTRTELNYHKRKQHTGIESFFCSECGLGFKLRTSLQKHIVNRHENLQEEYHCDITGCQLTFLKKIFLTNHKINDHRMERKYLCQVCGNKFYTRCSLSSHLETHSNKKKFECSLCNRILKTKEKLTLHFRTHTGEKPFPCTLCSKSFISKSKLDEHTRRHRGEKRHKCNECGKLYANGFDLKQHLKKCYPRENNVTSQSQNVSNKTTVSLSTLVKKINDSVVMKQYGTILSEKDQQITDMQLSKISNDSGLQQTPISTCSDSTNQVSSDVSTNSSTTGSGMVVQLDNNGRVIALPALEVHVVDNVPYFQSPDPIHIVMPPQTLVVTGYDNVMY